VGKKMPRNPEYLGAGVYVSWDGYAYTLMANDHNNPTDVIVLDPNVLRALVQYDKATVAELIKSSEG